MRRLRFADDSPILCEIKAQSNEDIIFTMYSYVI